MKKLLIGLLATFALSSCQKLEAPVAEFSESATIEIPEGYQAYLMRKFYFRDTSAINSPTYLMDQEQFIIDQLLIQGYGDASRQINSLRLSMEEGYDHEDSITYLPMKVLKSEILQNISDDSDWQANIRHLDSLANEPEFMDAASFKVIINEGESRKVAVGPTHITHDNNMEPLVIQFASEYSYPGYFKFEQKIKNIVRYWTRYHRQGGPNTEHGGDSLTNCFHHAMFQSVIIKKYEAANYIVSHGLLPINKIIARIAGFYNETRSTNKYSKRMDLHNNKVARWRYTTQFKAPFKPHSWLSTQGYGPGTYYLGQWMDIANNISIKVYDDPLVPTPNKAVYKDWHTNQPSKLSMIAWGTANFMKFVYIQQ